MAAVEEEIIWMIQSARTRQETLDALRRSLSRTTSLVSTDSSWFPIGESLIHALNPSFVGVLSKREYETLFVEIFIRAPPADSISLLVHSLGKELGDDKSRSAYVLEKALNILDIVVRRNLGKLAVHFTSPANVESFCWDGNEAIDRLVQDLSSIPDRAAAITRGNCIDERSALNPRSYSKFIALSLVESLKYAHDSLQSGQDCSLKFSSALLAKVYSKGYGREVMQILAPGLYAYCCDGGEKKDGDDYIWRRLSQRLLIGVHTLALDSVVADLVLVLSRRHPDKLVNLEKILGDSVEKDEKIKYVLTNKLLMTRHFDETTRVPETIAHYLASSSERVGNILIPTLIKLLTVWSSATSTTRTNFEKHFYISRTIVIFSNLLSNESKANIQADSSPLILRGIGNHLNAADENIRKIGMVVGELLTNLFAGNGNEEKLKFDYEEDDRTQNLKRLLERNHGEFLIEADLEYLTKNEESDGVKSGPSQYNIAKGVDSDDDDDLVPFDLPKEEEDEESGNIGTSTQPSPIYIKDCLECIVERKSYPTYQKALNSLENLIRRNSPGADDLAVEITRTLLHAQDYFGLGSTFVALQISIMTASCVKQPKGVAVYLCQQFYDNNYSIQHRFIILDVLAKSATELSKPMEKEDDDVEEVTVISKKEPPTPTPAVPTWRRVVQDRVEKKTRRWGSAVLGHQRKPDRIPVANRLAPVAGPCFFYPLLTEIDKRMETLDMFGRDHIVLGRLLFTLGTIIYHAENAPGICQMATTVMQFVLYRTVKHDQPFVRQGALFALIMVCLVTPARVLALELQDEVVEAQYALEQMDRDEPDEQCRALIEQAVNLLGKKCSEGMNSIIEIGLPK